MLLSSPRLFFAVYKVKPIAAKLQPVLHRVRGVFSHSRFPSTSPSIHSKVYFSSCSIGTDMETVDTSYRLSELRRLMRERKLDIYS
jgi:hypothetical protein